MTGKAVGMKVSRGNGVIRRAPAENCGRPIVRAPRAAFTLIEILVVVSIISILAAIAVPNFLEAQTRAKVSRARNDMRVVAVALESYQVDNNKYPVRTKTPGGLSFLGLADTTRRAEEMALLTTPIAYVSNLPIDVFEIRVEPPNNLIDYYSPIIVEHMRDSRFSLKDFPASVGASWDRELERGVSYSFGWMLLSVGPDTILGNTSRNQGNYPHQTTPVGNNPNDNNDGGGFSWAHEYDATNGTTSFGNLTRFQKNGATADDAFSTDPK